jgi:hypothetical protein
MGGLNKGVRSDRKVDAGKLMGRRLALNRKRMERFLEAIRLGVSFPGACDCVGWCDRSVYRYLKRGRDALEAADINEEEDPLEHLDKLAKSEQLFAELAVKYEAAMSGSEEAHLEKLLEFGKGDWKSRAWVLERRWPERYTRTRKIGADLAKAESDAKRAESEAAIAQLQLEAMKRGGGTSRLLLPADLVQSMAADEPELAEQLLGYLARKGVQTIQRADIKSGVSAEDMAEVSPSTVH